MQDVSFKKSVPVIVIVWDLVPFKGDIAVTFLE